MNSVQCVICENVFLSTRLEGKIQPWNCPHCNKDTDDKIQKDLNDLYKMIGFQAIQRLQYRADRLLILKQMLLKQQPEPILFF
uniref:Uncharacterized protein n=1 Tax=viral metagenome TaxID=1070528 RepID=A0A6C0JTQ7_9ZZZZ